jgi:hypothetical protein
VVHIKFYFFLVKDWYYGEWAFDEWVSACKSRSAIEFLFELYGDTEFRYFLPEFKQEAEAIDSLLREKVEHGVYTPYDLIPEGIPTTHWWWWYPAEPPDHK